MRRRGWLVCAVLAALACVSTQQPTAVLLQGTQDRATLDALGRGAAGRSVSDVGIQARVAGEEVGLLRDVVAVSQALQSGVTGAVPGPKVKLEVFTSAADADCRKVWHRLLGSLLQKQGMMDIVDLRLVFVGDAKGEHAECDGGATCIGNMWGSCLVDKFPDPADFFPVLNCIEGRACATGEEAPAQCYGSVPEVALVCSFEFGEDRVDGNALQACVDGEEGNTLLAANAQATATLSPPAGFLPWIIVDGQPLSEEGGGIDDYILLGKAICDAYAAQGGSEPYQCSRFPQTLGEATDPWALGPTTDNTAMVPVVRSDEASGVQSGIFMMVLMLGVALGLGCCFCEPRLQDEDLIDGLLGRVGLLRRLPTVSAHQGV